MSDRNSKILLFGGTGNVGRPLLRALLERGEQVRVVTRALRDSDEQADGVEYFEADFDSPETFSGSFDQVDRVFLLVPVGSTELYRALAALSAVLDAGIERVVYLSNDLAARAPLIPHAGSKVGIEAAIRAAPVTHTILRPTYFAQNDVLLKDALLNGSYPVPLGKMPISRSDVRDVAEAAAAALVDGECANETVLMSSPEQPTGDETADLWSQALGLPVACTELSPEEWAQAQRDILPAWLAYDLGLMYRQLQATGHPVAAEDLDAQARLLSRPPRRYRDFIEECAGEWTAR